MANLGHKGEHVVSGNADVEQLRVFMKHLLKDLRALEHMIAEGMIESGVRRIGVEQEMFLVDRAWRPAPVACEVLDRLDDPRFTTELGLFNLEFNLDPVVFGGDCLRRMENQLTEHLSRVREAAKGLGADILLTGILPTLAKSDLTLDNITPKERYFALNDALKRLRGGAFDFRFSGTDELIVRHDSVMLEACNTSCQFHFQVGPDEFAHLYNIAQAVAGPVLAAATNSPLLFGRRLWKETRIALFQQAIDTRAPDDHVDDRAARVHFGNGWVKETVLEILRDDIANHRVLFGIDIDEDPFDAIREGTAPRLRALQLHNSTVYRWNRPCYGVLDGKPHLRIENRILPAGPTVLDEVANAAFWFGLLAGTAKAYEDVSRVMAFDTAKTNFLAAAQLGLDTQLVWLDGRRAPADELIVEVLLPLAQSGLEASSIDTADINRYLDVIERRVRTGQTGAKWLLDSYADLKDKGTEAERLVAITSPAASRQLTGEPVSNWTPARIEEAGGRLKSFVRVEQFMSTELFTVHEDEVVDLVANLMDWRKIRHVLVVDDQQRLIGLVSYRALLRFLGQDVPHGKDHPVSVQTIMQKNPITVTPETPTLEVIGLMRRHRIGCLPVVRDERLVGVVTESDFIDVAGQLLEARLGAS